MFRLFSLAAAERGRQKRRLELSLAGICELELLKRRHEALIAGALALHEPEPERAERPSDDTSPPVSLPHALRAYICIKNDVLNRFD
uniref:Uncharacterized protein n=1 Tax=Sinocyclocheilus rhinocerous TaxID=307959 RepID=A0A673LB92_9TELE